MTQRQVHLGIGAFARAHTLVHTAADPAWEVVAFTGRGPQVADDLTAQGGRYGVVVRGPERDEVELIDIIAAAHPADDVEALRRVVADPGTHVVTLTITEKGYRAGNDPATSAPARLALALRARREAGIEAPIALVSCDNLSGNGEILGEAVLAAIDAQDDAATREWLSDHVDLVSTMVDRITPAAGDAERRIASEALGFEDRATVVTEPFHEWVIEDRFRGRRPAWERAGAQLTDDVALHENRKLRLLNGAHTLLAYGGQSAGHATVPEAMADLGVRQAVTDWWQEARRTIDLPAEEIDAYLAALAERFGNERLAHALIRIAADGSEKLAVRTLPVIAELGGPAQAPAAVAVVRAWTDWVTARVRADEEVADPRAEQIAEAARRDDDCERVRALVGLIGGGATVEGLDLDALTGAVLAAS